MAAQFQDEARLVRFPRTVAPTSLVLVTGTSFGPMLKPVIQKLSRIRGLTVRQVTVRNRFFGPSVTVAGLLTGSDIFHAIKGKRTGDLVLVPANALKEDEDLFLDGMTLAILEKKLAAPVRKAAGVREIAAFLREREER
jgi:NifB/MoaA-like Fe-S oxidoreductase